MTDPKKLAEQLANAAERKSIRAAMRSLVREASAHERWRDEGDENGW